MLQAAVLRVVFRILLSEEATMRRVIGAVIVTGVASVALLVPLGAGALQCWHAPGYTDCRCAIFNVCEEPAMQCEGDSGTVCVAG